MQVSVTLANNSCYREQALVKSQHDTFHFYFVACNLATNCDECVTSIQDFECSWCPGVWRCSDGIDWYRQEWRNTECLTSVRAYLKQLKVLNQTNAPM